MHFIDEVSIQVHSGNGGHGCSSFRREKYVPFGGPDGGHGGDGGHVLFKADERLNTLANFRGKRVYRAEHGSNGQGSQCDGRAGEDLVIKVPVGTQIFQQAEGRQELLCDLKFDGEIFLAAKGGRGGLGNMFFKSSTNQAPKHSQDGEDGESLDLQLELKLLADIGLVGLPNAGKSTLISAISAAKPKIADYPFTTLIPNLGVVKQDEDSLVLADIPGLIEKASEGKGLGHQFLKHIERTQAIVHLVDVSWCLDEYEAFEGYATVRHELGEFNPEILDKREIVCLTKIDAMTETEVEGFQKFFESQLGKKVLPISAVSGKNIDLLTHLMFKSLEGKQAEEAVS